MRRVTMLAAAALVVTATGCALTDGLADSVASALHRLRRRHGPTITHHPPPGTSVDFSPFEDAGCAASQASASCLDCEPDAELGALTPAYSIAECILYPDGAEREAPGYLRCGGGLRPTCVRYVVWKDDSFEAITSEDDFRALFAPIKTPEEAHGYAIALSGHSAYYGLEFNPEYTYYVDQLEDTHVDTDDSGYRVHLYLYRWLGCGPHETYAIVHRITPEGRIAEESREPVFRDPREDDLCVD